MAQQYNKGGTTSTIGKQFNDFSWSRAAVIEAKKKKVFSQLGDKLTQPKHYGDTIKKYHEIPILHASNINDQGIDANGVKLTKGKWYAYDASGAMVGSNSGYDTKVAAQAIAGSVSVKSGNGNLYGGSKDINVQRGAFPVLRETGGLVNRVGIIRKDLEAKVEEFGYYMSFTKKSLDMDTETGLLARYSRMIGEAQGDIRESQIRADLMDAGSLNRTFAGNATSLQTIDVTDVLTLEDLRLMDKSLKDAYCPKDTELIDGSTKYGTARVGKARYAYVGSELLATLEDMTHNNKSIWEPVEDYANSGMIADGEIGRIGQFRFIEVEEMSKYEGVGVDIDTVSNSSDAATPDSAMANFYSTYTATDVSKLDAFPILFVGSGSFATVGFEGDVARVQTVMPKADANNDPFGKNGSISISWYYGFMSLRPEWIRELVVPAKTA